MLFFRFFGIFWLLFSLFDLFNRFFHCDGWLFSRFLFCSNLFLSLFIFTRLYLNSKRIFNSVKLKLFMFKFFSFESPLYSFHGSSISSKFFLRVKGSDVLLNPFGFFFFWLSDFRFGFSWFGDCGLRLLFI